MPRFPRQYGPLIYGVIQSGITTAIASGIATFSALGFNAWALKAWGLAWIFAWITMLPVVIVIAPMIQRLVIALTVPAD